jgi:hypothetical protein
MGSIAHIGLPNEAVVQALREAIEKNSEIIQNFRDTKLNMIVTEIEAGGSKMASIDRTKVPKTA